MTFGDNLKEYRLSKGWTQKELARKLELSRSYTSELESNKRNPSLDTINKIADKLNISTYFLLEGKKTLQDLDDGIRIDIKDLHSLKEREQLQTLIANIVSFDPQKYSQNQLKLLQYAFYFIEETAEDSDELQDDSYLGIISLIDNLLTTRSNDFQLSIENLEKEAQKNLDYSVQIIESVIKEYIEMHIK